MAFACRKHKRIRCKPCRDEHRKAVEALLVEKGLIPAKTEPPKK